MPALASGIIWLALAPSGSSAAESPRPRDTDARRIESLVADLGTGPFWRRDRAGRELVRIGEPSLIPLRIAAIGDHPERRWRSRQLVRVILNHCRVSPSTGMEFAVIDRGSFVMGSPTTQGGRSAEEVPHRVRINQPFLIGTYEVTQSEYEQMMGHNPSWFGPSGEGKDKVKGLPAGLFPVDQVSWYDAAEFCNRMSREEGFPPYYELTDVASEGGSIVRAGVAVVGGEGYRLPTEAEWEYACRAMTGSPFHYGGERNGRASNVKGVSYSVYGSEVVGPNLGRTTRVGSYPPNGWGLHDTHGNVAEWCQDIYSKDYYRASPTDDPAGPEAGPHRVVRGGSWLLGEANARSAARASLAPGEKKYFVGFRVARTP